MYLTSKTPQHFLVYCIIYNNKNSQSQESTGLQNKPKQNPHYFVWCSLLTIFHQCICESLCNFQDKWSIIFIQYLKILLGEKKRNKTTHHKTFFLRKAEVSKFINKPAGTSFSLRLHPSVRLVWNYKANTVFTFNPINWGRESRMKEKPKRWKMQLPNTIIWKGITQKYAWKYIEDNAKSLSILISCQDACTQMNVYTFPEAI